MIKIYLSLESKNESIFTSVKFAYPQILHVYLFSAFKLHKWGHTFADDSMEKDVAKKGVKNEF